MIDLTDLINRIREASVDQQHELLVEAFDAFYPYPGPDHYLVGNFEGIDWTWDRLRQRFMQMLVAEAYESAALMLVPEGCVWSMMTDYGGLNRATISDIPRYIVTADAETLALALARAALKVKKGLTKRGLTQ